MECVRQDEGDGGKLWDAMRPQKTLGAALAGRPTYRWCEFLELRELSVVNLVKSVI